jgi:phage shock protein A
MSDIVDRLNDSLSAGYSELRKEAAQEILQLRKERDTLRAELLDANETVRELFHGAGVANMTITSLLTKIEAMENQEPVAQVAVHKTGGNAGIAWSARPLNEFDSLPLLREGDRLSPAHSPRRACLWI